MVTDGNDDEDATGQVESKNSPFLLSRYSDLDQAFATDRNVIGMDAAAPMFALFKVFERGVMSALAGGILIIPFPPKVREFPVVIAAVGPHIAILRSVRYLAREHNHHPTSGGRNLCRSSALEHDEYA